MKEIELSQGKVALVDDEDFDWLNQWKWSLSGRAPMQYATRRPHGDTTKNIKIRMHCFIMEPPKGMVVDHIDMNCLNNQRANLRICTKSQNGANRGKTTINKSGYKGVSKFSEGVWRAKVVKNYIAVFRKLFRNPEEAARAYDKAAKEAFGEFAKLNFPE